MPLELGIFLGAKEFGQRQHRSKSCLILDRDPHRYMQFCSDLAGHDIRAHGGRRDELIRGVRNWLSNQLVSRGVQVPGAAHMSTRYQQFRADLSRMCARLRLSPRELTFSEHRNLVIGWLKANPWQSR
jgi:hypothetical protein